MKRILWFRRDLRTEDNPLLSQEGNVLPLFIFDPNILSSLDANDRRISFIYHSLITLKTSLKKMDLDLAIFYGNPSEVFQWLLSHEHYDEVCASGDYDHYALERDQQISHLLPFNYLHDTYIFRSDEVVKNDGTPYQVFTPFYNRAKTLFTPFHMREYLHVEQQLHPFDYESLHQITRMEHVKVPIALESIGFEYNPIPQQELPPETKLGLFTSKLAHYAENRDFMVHDTTSGLSNDLRFGTISIRAVLRWMSLQKREGIDTEPFFRQLIFREFYAILLVHFPHLCERNFRYPFKGIPNQGYFDAFCTARTGVPIVDAGIRELLQTGRMHNRVRMITASFFTKNLLLPWQWGEHFFAKYLIDYDASSNILSWQWSAGTGVDPQPYFRIFNPYAQAAKFDAKGEYIRRWVPELDAISPQIFHNEEALSLLKLNNYPPPIVSHKISSKKALEYFYHHSK